MRDVLTYEDVMSRIQGSVEGLPGTGLGHPGYPLGRLRVIESESACRYVPRKAPFTRGERVRLWLERWLPTFWCGERVRQHDIVPLVYRMRTDPATGSGLGPGDFLVMHPRMYRALNNLGSVKYEHGG